MNRFYALALFLCIIFTASAQNDSFILHEWGTFTTLAGSNGKPLSGLYLEEEKLPSFVYSHKGFSPDPNTEKGIYKPCKGVTVKMETPVIYFYAKKELKVSLRVDFPKGTISQWYPARAEGEKESEDDTLNFFKPYGGWIRWNATILPPGKGTISSDSSLETKTWIAPRKTESNKVKVGDEVEKFLFYRGVGNFELPLYTWFDSDYLMVKNSGKAKMGYVLVYERDSEGVKMWWTGMLEGGATKKLEQPGTHLSETEVQKVLGSFTEALVKAGLYVPEAKAMIATWKESYFNSLGIKVFWIVPDDLTAKILPLQSKPEAYEKKRVLVGRSEILSPAFEKELENSFNEDLYSSTYFNDRYYLAYQERVSEMRAEQTNISEPIGKSELAITISPNPAQNQFVVSMDGLESPTQVQFKIYSISGQLLHEQSENAFGQALNRFVIGANLDSGSYLLKVITNGQTTVHSIRKM